MINKVLAGRKIIEAYQKAHQKSHNQAKIEDAALKGLNGLGFASFGDFYEANKQANIAEARRCYRITGHCDGCPGREKGCPNLGCPEREHAAIINRDLTFDEVMLNFFRLRNLPDHAPPNCLIRAEEIEKPAFDIYWGFSPTWTPEELAQLVEKHPWSDNE